MGTEDPHYRRDPVTGSWVLVAGGRASRPGAEIASTGEAGLLTAHAGDRPTSALAQTRPEECPFCPGAEAFTPTAVYTVPAIDSDPPLATPHGFERPAWSMRVVPNLYPAAVSAEPSNNGPAHGATRKPKIPPVQRPIGLAAATESLLWQAPGYGRHEVVIECPHHCWTVSGYSADHHRRLFEVYQHRLKAIKEETNCQYAVIFKNVGAWAGASQPHSHSQILATAITPPRVQQELRESAHYCIAGAGQNVFMDLMQAEREAGERVVAQTDGLLAWCPFGGRLPGEVWVAPKQRQARFEETPADLLGELGKLWPTLLVALEKLTPTKSYNYYLHTAPLDDRHWAAYHWHLEIVPRIVAVGGFELASGSFINPLPAEAAAARWREALEG